MFANFERCSSRTKLERWSSRNFFFFFQFQVCLELKFVRMSSQAIVSVVVDNAYDELRVSRTDEQNNTLRKKKKNTEFSNFHRRKGIFSRLYSDFPDTERYAEAIMRRPCESRVENLIRTRYREKRPGKQNLTLFPNAFGAFLFSVRNVRIFVVPWNRICIIHPDDVKRKDKRFLVKTKKKSPEQKSSRGAETWLRDSVRTSDVFRGTEIRFFFYFMFFFFFSVICRHQNGKRFGFHADKFHYFFFCLRTRWTSSSSSRFFDIFQTTSFISINCIRI